MNFVIIEKARPHKYIRREGTPGKYEYFYQEPGVEKKQKEALIETAPPGMERIEKYREEARARLIEWQHGGIYSRKYSDEQILWEGYQWRKWAHSKQSGESGWNWAMWEEIQRFAKQKGFTYKEKLTKQEILDNPMIPDVDELLDGFGAIADEVTTNWRNRANRSQMWRFINSPEGKNWSITSRRELWGQVKAISEDDIRKNYPGLIGLRRANSWNEALNTEVEVYRGIPLYYTSAGPPEGGEKPYTGRKFVSYTVVPAMADKFARGYYHSYDAGEGKGIVVKRRIRFGDILGFVNNDGENEVLVKPPKKEEHIPLVGPERITYERRDKSR